MLESTDLFNCTRMREITRKFERLPQWMFKACRHRGYFYSMKKLMQRCAKQCKKYIPPISPFQLLGFSPFAFSEATNFYQILKSGNSLPPVARVGITV
jgi:hypothetical protein